MNKLITFILILFVVPFSWAGLDELVSEIEKNNTLLEAMRQQMEARSLAHRTGIFLQNPEFEYAWFAGSPADMGSKTGISVRQQFDFPTAYRHRNQLSLARNEQLQWEYRQVRSDVLLEARLTLIQYVHVAAMLNQLLSRRAHAQGIADAYARMYELGEANIMDYNKARLNLLDISQRVQQLTLDQNRLQASLEALNGGKPLGALPASYPLLILPDSFENWMDVMKERNPGLLWYHQEVIISQREEQLQKAVNLPSFHVGYVSEMLTHEQFRGFAVGLSVPLWENKNTLRSARAHTQVLQLQLSHLQLEYYLELKSEHARLQGMLETFAGYQDLLGKLDHSQQLARAHEAGEISLTQYLLELSYYYQGMDTLLEMEWELQKGWAALNKYSY